MTVTTATPGKLILLGEYAVLDGAPALVTAVNKFAKIIIEKSEESNHILNAPNLDLNRVKFIISNNSGMQIENKLNELKKKQLKLFDSIFAFINKELHKIKIDLKFLKISIDTTDFYDKNTHRKYGLGSSAALTVGLIKSVFEFHKISLPVSQLFQSALQAHFEAQGKTGSGIDIAASSFGGVGIFSNKNNSRLFKKINLPHDLFLIPIWTGDSTSTPGFVSKTKQLKNENPEKYELLMQKLGDLSDLGNKSFLKNDTNKFLNIVDEFYNALNELGKSAGIPIISKTHQKIKKIVKDCHGYYKPSGAGGSDIGIAFTNDQKVKENIINKINESEFKYIKLETVVN